MMLKIKKKFLPPFGDVYIGPLNRKWYFVQLLQIQILEHKSQRIQRPHTLNTDPQNFTLKGPQRLQRLHILNINNQIPHSTLGGLTLSSSGTSHPEPRCQKPKQNQKVWKQTLKKVRLLHPWKETPNTSDSNLGTHTVRVFYVITIWTQ